MNERNLMSKIEVLRVPDERATPVQNVAGKGTLLLMRDGFDARDAIVIRPHWHAALLAALLVDAGATEIIPGKPEDGYMPDVVWVGDGAKYWRIPIPE